jgi:hypothetical protein
MDFKVSAFARPKGLVPCEMLGKREGVAFLGAFPLFNIDQTHPGLKGDDLINREQFHESK